MAATVQKLLSSVRDPNVPGYRLLTTALQQHGIPCVLWGVSAAIHYGGGLCSLDFEIVLNAADQQSVFELLTSHDFPICVPNQEHMPTCFNDWAQVASAAAYSQYQNRCRTRLVTPMYELPATGDPMDDFVQTFVIVYSADDVGLPPIPSLWTTMPGNASMPGPYVALAALDPDLAVPIDSKSCGAQIQDVLIPSFALLVRSEMHVLLMYAEVHSPVWGQHMAQLSELVHSKARPETLDKLVEVVEEDGLVDFIPWFKASLKGEADYSRLESLQADYRQRCQRGL